MLKVYLETTIPSYLTAWPSRDVLMFARQELTRQWWDTERHKSDLYTSEYVLAEASAGDAEAAKSRLALLSSIPLLDISPAMEQLANKMLETSLIPEDAATDAFHIAVCVVHQMDVMLTWNCRHLANPVVLKKVNQIVAANGYEPLIICTPEELMGGS